MRRAGIRRLLDRLVDHKLHRCAEDGQGLAEYALIISFVTIACVAALTALGVALPPMFDGVTAAL